MTSSSLNRSHEHENDGGGDGSPRLATTCSRSSAMDRPSKERQAEAPDERRPRDNPPYIINGKFHKSID